jgi:hypothetical protein
MPQMNDTKKLTQSEEANNPLHFSLQSASGSGLFAGVLALN